MCKRFVSFFNSFNEGSFGTHLIFRRAYQISDSNNRHLGGVWLGIYMGVVRVDPMVH